MADIICLHSKDEIEAFCRRSLFVHIYSLGDLDEFFWPYTTWYALRAGGEIRQLALVYTGGQAQPTLLAYAEEPASGMRELLRGLLPVLPRRFYAHITQSATDVLADAYNVQSHGDYHKMGLFDVARLAAVDDSDTVRLSEADETDLRQLYAAAYPANFFVPRMLQTGFYFSVRRDGMLSSVAGVHVYSKKYKVAALGNITTRPEYRGQGLATRCTARLCKELLNAGIESIGLNVNAANGSAVACYTKLGFAPVAGYGEYSIELR